jgi:hypothetical protein
MFVNNIGITFPDGSFQDRKAPRMYTNYDLWLFSDLVPGDYFYDDGDQHIYIFIRDAGTGVDFLKDITPQGASV